MIDALPTPHGDKLRALLENAKLPRTDKPRVSAAIERYASWLTEMEETKDRGEGFVIPLVESLNRYKNMTDSVIQLLLVILPLVTQQIVRFTCFIDPLKYDLSNWQIQNKSINTCKQAGQIYCSHTEDVSID